MEAGGEKKSLSDFAGKDNLGLYTFTDPVS